MILELKGIYKNYFTDDFEVPVLKDVNLSVEQGDYLAIMGPSGSGKSTLMNIIGCLDKQTEGTYLFDGIDISKQNDSSLSEIRNKGIGFVFQSFNLLPKQTALENVELPLLYGNVKKKKRREIAKAALKKVGLEDRMNFLPTQLSGGQKQRVAIARAIATNPKILLADEPTGALDSQSGKQVMELFKQLNQEGVTIVMITHEQSIADCANSIAYIRDGELFYSDQNTPQAQQDCTGGTENE
ncbi:MAG: ABC transporter ATP-binding protein [Acutalibacteraceae bacterium]|nr:ABC transporter ATP-binding protein [Acutalibacteraceae bacterium]